MSIEFEYYYNNVPGKGRCRNNLIYTSLISKDKKTFVQWYHNDTEYHKGQNQVVDPSLMQEKFDREIRYLNLMGQYYSNLVPTYDIDIVNKKIYLSIQNSDMWELAGCKGVDYSDIVPDWDEQMLKIFEAHKTLGMTKYSLHPSSYFVVDGQLKSINYFFAYGPEDKEISLRSVMSHISEDRQKDLFPKMIAAGIDIDQPTSHKDIQILAFESFKTNFREDVMERAKTIYV